MEHIVQFAIGIDDEAIKKNLEKSAVKQITKNIQADVETAMFNSRYNYGYRQQTDVDKIARRNGSWRWLRTLSRRTRIRSSKKLSRNLPGI